MGDLEKEQMNNSWILTYTGKKFFPLEPQIEDIDIIDIAHALSNMCRFTGHVREFYSVAQHSVLVGERIWNQTKDYKKLLSGLLHDASEAYICDIARPVKHSDEFRSYRQIEANLQGLIDFKFHTSADLDCVKEADNYLLSVEAFHLMPNCKDWALTIEEPEDFKEFSCWSPQKAKDNFLSAFLDYSTKR